MTFDLLKEPVPMILPVAPPSQDGTEFLDWQGKVLDFDQLPENP